MKYLVTFARIIVGNLFIFSGVVKANDPLGFSYKLEEYFVEFGMNWEWLHSILVPLAAALCIAEIIMGVAVLVGWRMKEISWSLLLMIGFFTILTGASAIFEIVRSCGCFGDAIPLTPWQSFYKDIVLLVLILIIFVKRNVIKPWENNTHLLGIYLISSAILFVLGKMLDWSMASEVLVFLWVAIIVKYISQKPSLAANVAIFMSVIYSLYLTIGSSTDLPFKDFRPYAIGKNLPDQMTLPEGAIAPVYENILVYKNTKTGETKEFTNDTFNASKIWEDKDWEWVNTENELIEEGDVAAITDLTISNHDGEELTDLILAEEKALWIVCYDMNLTDKENLKAINELSLAAQGKGIKVYGLSSAGEELSNNLIKEYDLSFDFYVTDGIVLKTMLRSNPGIMYLENGTVKGKWHQSNVPAVDELK
ncbi:DoxX family protein [Vicingaceae bacterium]|nr:DoxX family protein [Vicingaceae bacterium]MDC1452609.1 DoxX family protein [Vicingaceae bacterium]